MKLILENLKTGEVITIDKKLTIGRKSADKIIQNDHALSRIHCELKQENDKLYIKDLGARNPVAINAKKISSNKFVQIRSKDKVIIGSSLYIVKESCPEDESTRVFNLSDLKEEFEEKTILDFVNVFYKKDKAFIISNITGSIMLGLVEAVEFWYTTPATIFTQCAYTIIIWNISLFIFFLIHKKVVIELIKFKLIEFLIFFIGNFLSFMFSVLIALSFQSKETKAIHYTNENIERCSNISSSREYKKCYETIVNINKLSNQAQIDSFGKSLNKLHKEKPSVHTKDLLTLFTQKKYKELIKEVQIQRKKQKALRRKQKYLEEK